MPRRSAALASGGLEKIMNGRLKSWVVLIALCISFYPAHAQDTVKLAVDWNKVVRISRTTPTLQVVVNPPLRRGTPVHDNAFKALHDLQADLVRYVPWMPYPKLGVAELDPPANGKTSWDFSLIDPMTIDFLEATKGHPVILNFSTIPQWMFQCDKPLKYPADPNEVNWEYEQCTDLRDPSMKEVADYYARLVAWYTQGGFTDEAGAFHKSGYHYPVAYWEVLNEVEYEHQIGVETYTRLYDEVVSAIQRVEPDMKFVGLGLATTTDPHYYEYFLDHKNHKAGTPLDFISYHFYAVPTPDQTPEVEQYTYFDQADGFLKAVRFIEATRQRLSPETRTTVDELGVIEADDLAQGQTGHVAKALPDSYWNLAGAMYAYVFGELTHLGIDAAGESQLVGFPTQFPSVSMVNWNDGSPNARFWVLKLLHDNIGPGDKIVEVKSEHPHVYSLASIGRDGKHRMLLVNKRNRSFSVSVAGAAGGQIEYVDQSTGAHPPATGKLATDSVQLGGFSVAVITFP